jgi:hypothetical protein
MTTKVTATRWLGSIRVLATMLTEVQMHIGSILLVMWLVIGGIAAGQRGDYKHPVDCSSVSTTALTLLAGPLNYAHVDPHINCTTPRPSS